MGMNGGNRRGIIADINVTPLVDVMLVLMVIFMISAPLMYSGVKLNLPKTKKVNSLKLSDEQVIVSLKADGSLFLGKDQLDQTDLLTKLKTLLNESDVVFIRADENTLYGKVAALMAELKSNGITKISLVTKSIVTK